MQEKKTSKFKIVKLIIFVLLIFIAWKVFDYNQGVNTPKDQEGKRVLFTVEKGQGVKTISANLESQGLIRSKSYFETYVKNKKIAEKLKAGVYELYSNMSIKEIAELMATGQTLKNERDIKIIEGWNNLDIAEYFEKEMLFSKEEFMAEVKNKEKYAHKFNFIAEIPDPYDMEGYLFPDTYRIYKDAGVGDVVNKMLTNLERKLNGEMREEIARQGKSVFEIPGHRS